MGAGKKHTIDLETMPEEALLDTRICDLPIKIEGTWLSECIAQLFHEIEEKGIVFRPECYLADEWLTPEKETCIGIPFYLAHPALIRLEKKFMIDAEGETRPWCMKLLRHETGHAISYAYRFQKRKKWQKIFGPSTAEYGDTYKYRPYSKNYVRHLDGYYAQYHPDEDFSETFAVWLTPRNIPLSSEEQMALGGQLHPVLKYFGLMPAKGTAHQSARRSRISTVRLSCVSNLAKSFDQQENPEYSQSII